MRGAVLVAALPEGATRGRGASCSTATIPRDYRYQMFNVTLAARRQLLHLPRRDPRPASPACPPAATWSSRPTPPASQRRHARGRPRHARGSSEAIEADGGLDLKWTPTANTAIDATINPDFSQIESDVAQIGANERFALFFPEKRPFFLEGIELFSHADPGRLHAHRHRAALGRARHRQARRHRLHGARRRGRRRRQRHPARSRSAPSSPTRTSARSRRSAGVRRDFGQVVRRACSATDREIDGGGHNRVVGPDFQWRPTEQRHRDRPGAVQRQRTPDRPDLADEWDGRRLPGTRANAGGHHSTQTVDWFGAIPGLRRRLPRRQRLRAPGRATGKATAKPATPSGRRASCAACARSPSPTTHADREGDLLNRQISFGRRHGREVELLPARLATPSIASRAGEITLPRQQLLYVLRLSPSLPAQPDQLEGFVGEQIDFDERARRAPAPRQPQRHLASHRPPRAALQRERGAG